MRFQVRMVSCAERDQVRAQTLGSWAQTDWGQAPPVEMDDGQALLIAGRIEQTWLRALETATDDDVDFSLLLEDDLEFNRFLRHNLARWPPLMGVGDGALPFFGSLYRANQTLLWQDQASRCAIAAPETFWGAQALLISRGTARHLLAHWQPGVRAHDLTAARLAATLAPVYLHVPSLVQHRIGPSTWGGGVHQAPDFDPDYRADE
jgi:hypothetical protein